MDSVGRGDRAQHDSECRRLYNTRDRAGPRVRGRRFTVKERGNDEWLAALRGSQKDDALADLRLLLVRGLRAALHGRTSGIEPSIEDFVQEALIRILDNLDSFRGESRFTVWAQKIARPSPR